MQGRKGQAPLDPELQKAASRRAGQVPDEPKVGGEPRLKKVRLLELEQGVKHKHKVLEELDVVQVVELVVRF